MLTNQHSFIFLGDSYTIGEGVDLTENFPNQLVKKIKKASGKIFEPTIIAKTGWTTGELLENIALKKINGNFTFSTLLIGVNNQYRGMDINTYKKEFEYLLQKAIAYVDNSSHVFVVSIPDWGCTPFAKDRDRNKIRLEIDQYNEINSKISMSHDCNYIEITSGGRIRCNAAKFMADDGLHPSSAEYDIWSDAILASLVSKKLI
jgi:lysophospholipase L1-like esterase